MKSEDKLIKVKTEDKDWKQEYLELKRLHAFQEKELSKLQEENQLIKEENDTLSHELQYKTKHNLNLKEEINSQKIMFSQTSEYMNDVIEQAETQKKEIEKKNEKIEKQREVLEQTINKLQESTQELDQKNEEITQQRDKLEQTVSKLQENQQEMEMQKTYLESMVEELQQGNDEMEMQKTYLQTMVEDLEKSNKEVERQRYSLEISMKALKKNKVEIESQKKLLEQAFKELDTAYGDITSSINYAKRIQDSMLPRRNLLKQNFEDHLLFFKPRDIVSGDFYWFVKEGSKFIIAAVDCTGHGVPGALMSMLGMDLLNEIVVNKKNTSPEKILRFMDMGINYILDQETSNNRDGMDAAICTIDIENKTLEYAGAHNPIFLIQDNKAKLIKADKIGVGGFDLKQESIFTKHTISLDKPITIYIYSDGYQDQFGGKSRRKFMSKNFRELLFDIHQKPMKEQRKILDTILEEWKDGQSQVDDILVMGLKINLT